MTPPLSPFTSRMALWFSPSPRPPHFAAPILTAEHPGRGERRGEGAPEGMGGVSVESPIVVAEAEPLIVHSLTKPLPSPRSPPPPRASFVP